MTGNRWDDHYARRARAEKWPARSVYKLQEIDRKCKLIRKGHRLLDLGCYPGSWSQYALKKVGSQGEVVGIDLTRPERLSLHAFRFIQADVLTLDVAWLADEVRPRDVVISDLAPQTTGVRETDAARSMLLAQKALQIALALLKTKGNFACKVFEGQELQEFRAETASYFKNTRLIRPQAIRKRSREIYLIGLSLNKTGD